MKMKCFAVVLLLIGVTCASLYAQEERLILNNAIDNSAAYIAGRLKSGSMVVVFGFQAPTKELADYTMDRMIDHLVEKDEMKVIDRQNPDLIKAEIAIQYSGDVGDDYMQSIGQQFGADTIITGKIVQSGQDYQLQVRALNVETAQVQGARTVTLHMDSNLAALLNVSYADPLAWTNKRLYFGARAGGSIGLYETTQRKQAGWLQYRELNGSLAFGGAAFLSFQINPFLAVQTEVIFVEDKINAKYSDGNQMEEYGANNVESFDESYRLPSLMVPILVKGGWRGGRLSVFGIGGIYFNIPFYKQLTIDDGKLRTDGFSGGWLGGPETLDITPPLAGFLIGGIFGFKAGPGSVFLDARFAMDFGKVESWHINAWPQQHGDIFGRKNIFLSIGYEFGVIGRKR